MAKKYDVVATIGKYEKDGQTKFINRNVGAIIKTDKGFRLALDATFNPAGCDKDNNGRVWLALFEPRDDQPQQQANQQQAQQNRPQQNQQAAMPNYNDFDDDIPFAKHHSINGV